MSTSEQLHLPKAGHLTVTSTSSRRPAISQPRRSTSSAHTPRTFPGLSPEASRKFESLATCINLPPRSILINEGFTADRIFIVCSGSLKLVASSAGGRTLLLRVAASGEVIGLDALSTAAHYRLTAITLCPSTLLSIPRADFLRLMHNSTELSTVTSVAIARDYNAAFLSARRLGHSTSAAGRLASALLDWARMNHLDVPPVHTNLPIAFPMPLTHEELGSMAGVSRETVSRLLAQFRREGLVDQDSQQIVLHHPDQLENRYC